MINTPPSCHFLPKASGNIPHDLRHMPPREFVKSYPDDVAMAMRIEDTRTWVQRIMLGLYLIGDENGFDQKHMADYGKSLGLDFVKDCQTYYPLFYEKVIAKGLLKSGDPEIIDIWAMTRNLRARPFQCVLIALARWTDHMPNEVKGPEDILQLAEIGMKLRPDIFFNAPPGSCQAITLPNLVLQHSDLYFSIAELDEVAKLASNVCMKESCTAAEALLKILSSKNLGRNMAKMQTVASEIMAEYYEVKKSGTFKAQNWICDYAKHDDDPSKLKVA